MKKELKVLEFHKKQKLVDFVTTNSEEIEIEPISSSQMGIEFKHFLWYYEAA